MSKYATLGFMLQCILYTVLLAENGKAQGLSLEEIYVSFALNNTSIEETFSKIENSTEFSFAYKKKIIKQAKKQFLKSDFSHHSMADVLRFISENTGLSFRRVGETIHVVKEGTEEDEAVVEFADVEISGTITDENGEGLPGATVLIKGTSDGTTSDLSGSYKLLVSENAVLEISYVGYVSQEVSVGTRSVIDIQLVPDAEQLDEIVVIGYGTQKKSDLTGSVLQADIESFREQPNVSLFQSLQGSLPGLNVGQVDAAGEDPEISIRGRTSISGEQSPLVVLDGTIYRGNIVDINPNDIQSVDILKDASAASVYGSQAANGVIIITSKTGNKTEKTTINYSSTFTTQSAAKEYKAGSGQDYINQFINGDILNSRIGPDYLELNPSYDPRTLFKTQDMVEAYDAGIETNWYDLLTNDKPYLISQNLSLAHSNANVSTFMSVGYTDQAGYHVGEDYKRWNARLNLDNYVTNWLTIGIQSFITSSDFSGLDISRNLRYLSPYSLARDEDGELTVQPGGNATNPLRDLEEADHSDMRLNLFGNIYAKIDIPFIQGLSYKINYTTNYRNENEFLFRPYGANFQGEGSKENDTRRSYSSDNILTYQKTFAQNHNLTATLLYGFEKRVGNGTLAKASVFLDDVLGYNSLQSGQADLQSVSTTAYKEASLYSMARLIYGFQGKYLFTGTIRRDGFSGFGKDNKFGVFPSASVAWVISQEDFFSQVSWLPSLKIRASYGTSGNRTIGRYQTLAEVDGAFVYVDSNGSPLYGQEIISLASPNLKWETTTGINIGIDFALFKGRIMGNIDYYKNDTKDVLYEVNLPQLAGFSKIPINLGKLKNQGIDLSISSVNYEKNDLTWTSTFNFSRNRDELVELLGFDNDGDGVEDDIVSSGLFIGEPIDAIYDYKITGELFQIGDDIPSGFDVGAYKLQDLDGVDGFTPDDRTIIGYTSPSYRFSVQNKLQYKNWSLSLFINSVQGGKNRYLGEDVLTSWNDISSENVFDRNVPAGIDYWTPENPNARYQKLRINVSDGLIGTRYASRSFVRLQDVSLSYNFDSELLSKFNITRLKVFVSGKNLATWTGYNGWDPETNTALVRDGRPVMKSYSLGLNIEF
ncbi:TonB-dependent receptor [Reichenbachiella sp. MALMAid0571]|uniref:SusC/RagA family TonB-linked outer membrane protein n=1 Tax=Reichenbachiella sp. MALMAid0571 TaxID=3143939 RepID=UPI0032DF2332